MNRPLLVGALVAALIAGPAVSAQADPYQDPLVEGDLVLYNGGDYRLSITPVAGSAQVVRYGHPVAALHDVKVVRPGKTADTVVYSGRLGYSRTAYLNTKLTGQSITRDYAITTYVKKVVSRSADYAKTRVDAFVRDYRHRILRFDVKRTGQNVQAYVDKNGSLDGVRTASEVVLRSEGFFGYENATIRVLADTSDESRKAYVVYGVDPTDGYTAALDSATGKVLSGVTVSESGAIEE